MPIFKKLWAHLANTFLTILFGFKPCIMNIFKQIFILNEGNGHLIKENIVNMKVGTFNTKSDWVYNKEKCFFQWLILWGMMIPESNTSYYHHGNYKRYREHNDTIG